MSRGKRKKS